MESAYRGALLLAVAGELKLADADSRRGPLVLFGQHDRYQALRDGRIGRIGRMVSERIIVVVDLKKIFWFSASKAPKSCS